MIDLDDDVGHRRRIAGRLELAADGSELRVPMCSVIPYGVRELRAGVMHRYHATTDLLSERSRRRSEKPKR